MGDAGASCRYGSAEVNERANITREAEAYRVSRLMTTLEAEGSISLRETGPCVLPEAAWAIEDVH
jgi:hypothetical protein